MIPTNSATDNLHFSAQPELADFEGLAQQGYEVVVCNRPDGETPDQPSMDQVEQVLAAQGIKLVRYPVNPNTFPGEDLAALGKVFDGSDGKVLAYCRTGTRCANLWVASRAPEERAAAATKARSLGYDLSLSERLAG
ncbi:MAG: TIGR01244 family sulfur transferase [Halieaceae bacterium]|nr:TIGR01244 family sulfur transferase [Halieaceae bacterium]